VTVTDGGQDLLHVPHHHRFRTNSPGQDLVQHLSACQQLRDDVVVLRVFDDFVDFKYVRVVLSGRYGSTQSFHLTYELLLNLFGPAGASDHFDGSGLAQTSVYCSVDAAVGA